MTGLRHESHDYATWWLKRWGQVDWWAEMLTSAAFVVGVTLSSPPIFFFLFLPPMTPTWCSLFSWPQQSHPVSFSDVKIGLRKDGLTFNALRTKVQGLFHGKQKPFLGESCLLSSFIVGHFPSHSLGFRHSVPQTYHTFITCFLLGACLYPIMPGITETV